MQNNSFAMKRMYSFGVFVFLVISVAALSSCHWGKNRRAQKGKNIICVVDFSDSQNANERLRFFGNVIKDNIIPKLGRHDKITVIPIDKASLTNSTDILLKDFSTVEFRPQSASPMEEEQLIEKNLDAYRSTVSKEFESSFNKSIASRSKTSHATDIFGALEVVKGKIIPTDDNYIIFLSDMMNYSGVLNIEPSNTQFNSASVDAVLQKVPSFSMPGATALVITGEQVEVTPAHYSLVQSFWTKYFSKNNINLYDYNSASVSKLNALMLLDVSK